MAYSVQRAVSDGTLSTITLDIDFFAKEHISVLVADRILPNDDYTFSWIGSNTIKIVPDVANGAEVLIRRNTPYGESFHNFRLGAVFKDETMDENFKQVLFLTQEAIEGQTSTDFYTDLNFHGYKLRNVGPAVSAFDAVPLSQYLGDAAGAYQNRLAADAARVSANAAKDTAVASASSATASAGTASTKASEASVSAATATQKATEASASAVSAGSSASAAASSASAAAGSLASVNASATAALNSQNAAKASETAAAASATSASTSASSASASASTASAAATTATQKATDASASATAAAGSASAASGSASAASASKDAAKVSEDNAKAWADSASNGVLPNGSVTVAKLAPDVNDKFLDAAGDTVTGALTFNNNIPIQWKDASGTAFHVMYVGPGGNTNISIGPSGKLALISKEGTSIGIITNTGDLTMNGNVGGYSDIRLKTNIVEIQDALAKVQKLHGYTYTMKSTGRRHAGVIAQEVQAVLPEVVNTDNEGILSVAYGNIVALLIQAINELQSRVQELENK